VDIVAAFERAASAGAPLLERFRFAAEPLLAFEHHALMDAARGNGEPICAILEGGSVLAAERGSAPSADKALSAALEEVVRRLSNDNLCGSSLMTGFRYLGELTFRMRKHLNSISLQLRQLNSLENLGTYSWLRSSAPLAMW
jgi:hypothetical protein